MAPPFKRSRLTYETEGTNDNDHTIGAAPVRASTFKVPYVVRQLKHKTDTRFIRFNYGTVNTNFNTTTHAVWDPLSSISTGTGQQNRIGNSIYVKGVSFRYVIHGAVDTTAPHQDQVRVIAMIDKSGRDPSTLAPQDFLIGINLDQAGMPMLDPDHSDHIHFLYDMTHYISPDRTTAVSDNHVAMGQKYIPLNRAVTYADSLPNWTFIIFALSSNSFSAAPATPAHASHIYCNATVLFTDA